MQRGLTRLLVPPLFLLLSGCALPYYMQAATGQIKLLRQRVPIAELIEDPSVAPSTRERLGLVNELRRFAVARLDLPDNESYTTYVDLGRDSVVWNVVAAEEFSVDPLTWCFPVAGCVAYRGYFREERAAAYGQRLAERGYDTFVGGSPAYSTLGHFDDPVLNTMLARGEAEIAGMLFHELAHQRVYVKNDTELSESFASAVEQFGVELWLESRAQSDALARYRQRLERQQDFAALVARQRERLAAVFAEDAGVETLRREKADAYAQMRHEYDSLKAGWNGAGDFDGWFDGEFNNARLVALTSYQRWVPGLRRVLERLGTEAFYAEIDALTELEPEARLMTLEAWNQASAMAALPDQRELVDGAL